MTRRTPLTQWDTETESPPQERTQTICTCLHCTMRYLSDYEYNKASIWTLSSQDSDENALYLIDENLHNNLHILWIGEFINLFSPLSAITGIFWYLRPVDLDERVFYPPIWNSSVKAKVRFECESCGNIWTSMRGIAVFSVHPNEIYLNALNLRFTLLGQRCNNCDSKVFQSAIWYPEEVIRVLNYVYWQICNELFFINTIPQVAALGPQVDVQQEVNLSESCRAHQTVNTDCQLISLANDLHDPILKSLLTCRPGKPLKKHFSDQCEACMRGVCCVPNSSKVTEISRGPRVQLHEPHIRHRRQNPSPNKIDNGGEEESVISEQKVETAASVESEQVEQSMAKLCLNVPTNRTQFGLTGSPDKRGGDDVAFGLLRVGEWLENTTKTRVMKRWKSCGDLVAAYEEMTAKEIH